MYIYIHTHIYIYIYICVILYVYNRAILALVDVVDSDLATTLLEEPEFEQPPHQSDIFTLAVTGPCPAIETVMPRPRRQQ